MSCRRAGRQCARRQRGARGVAGANDESNGIVARQSGFSAGSQLGRSATKHGEHMALADDLDEFFEKRLPAQPPRPQVRPIVGVDECMNHPVVRDRLFELQRARHVQYVTPCWYQVREDPTGREVLRAAFPSPANAMFFPDSTPVKHTMWSDEQVLWQLVANFQCGDGLFFVSENLRGDPAGIWRLLDSAVKPRLVRWHLGRFWLVVLWRKHGTSYVDYAAAMSRIISTHSPAPGYSAQCL